MAGKLRAGAFDHIADPPPLVIDWLTVLCSERASDTDRARAMKALRAVLANWNRFEDLDQLKLDLGIEGAARARRKQSVSNRDERLSMAVMSAAMSGYTNPFKRASEQTGEDPKTVKRAWIRFAALRLSGLDAIASLDHPQFSDAARAAIAILEGQATK